MSNSGVAERNRFLAAVDHLFGYDVFVSYGRRDATPYARQLAEELEALDLSCFLDRRELPAGDPLDESLRAALRRSSVLVVISTPRARASTHVAGEVETFARTKRPIVPIVLDGKPIPWPAIRERKLVWIEDAPEAVSPATVAAVTGALKVMRKRTLASRVMLSTAAVMLVVSVFAMLAAVWARREQGKAEEQRGKAELATVLARREEKRAKNAAALADQRRVTANIEALARQALAGNQDRDQTLLIAAASVRRAQKAKLPVLATAEHALRQAVARAGGVPLIADERTEVRRFTLAGGRSRLFVRDERALREVRLGERGATSARVPGGEGWLVTSHDGRVVAAYDDRVSVWRDGKLRLDVDAHSGSDTCAVSPDGRWLAAGDYVYDLHARDPEKTAVRIGEFFHSPDLSFSPDGKWLVAFENVFFGDSFLLWEMTGTGPQRPPRLQLAHTYVPAAPPSLDDEASSSPPEQQPPPPPPDPMLVPRMAQTSDIEFSAPAAIVFSPDGRWMAIAGRDAVAVWDLSKESLPRIELPAEEVVEGSIAFSRSSEWLFIGGKTPRAVRAPTFRKSIRLGRDEVTILAVSRDGRWLATAGENIQLWDLAAATPFARPRHALRAAPDTNTFEMLGKYVRTLEFSGDGRWLISASATGRLWDLHQSDPNVAPIALRLDLAGLPAIYNPNDWVLRYFFTADSRYLLALGSVGGAADFLSHYRLIPLRSDDLLRFVDERVKRPFTEAEWAWLFPGEPFPSR